MLRLPQTLRPPWIQMKLQTLACFQWDSTWIMVVWLKLTFLAHVCTEWRRSRLLPGANGPFFRYLTLSFVLVCLYLLQKNRSSWTHSVKCGCLWPGDFCPIAAGEYTFAPFMFPDDHSGQSRSANLGGEKMVFTVSSSICSFTPKWFHYAGRFQLLIFSSRTPVKQLCTQHLAHLALCLLPTGIHCHLLGGVEVIISPNSPQLCSAAISPWWFHGLLQTNHSVFMQTSYLNLAGLFFFFR